MTAAALPGDSPRVPREGRVFPGFAFMGWRWISRNPAAAIAPVLVPFIFLYFLRLVSPASYFPAEVVGAMLFTTQNIGNWVLGDSATWRIENAIQDMFIASPLGKLRYLLGIAVSNLIPAVPALAVMAGLLVWVTPGGIPWVGWLALLGSILVLWVVASAIGIMMSSRIQSRREVWPVGNLTFTTLGMLSPLYYPLSVLPPAWQVAALFFPSTYAALLARGAMGLGSGGPFPLPWDGVLLGVLAVIGTVVALHYYRWGE